MLNLFIEYHLTCIIFHYFISHIVINFFIRTEDDLTLSRNMFAIKKFVVYFKCIAIFYSVERQINLNFEQVTGLGLLPFAKYNKPS